MKHQERFRRGSGAAARRARRRGGAASAIPVWIVGLAIMGLPFLRDRDAVSWDGEDKARAASRIDIPFDEDLADWETDFGEPLGQAIAEAADTWFGPDGRASGDLFQAERLEPGRKHYQLHCAGCHGDTGDGSGPAARHLNPRPRNFRSGKFKFTSTDTGQRPLPGDLHRTITKGLVGSAMPNFRLLPDEKRHDIVEYVRYLSIRGEFEQLMLDIAWEDEELPDADEVAEIVLDRWHPSQLSAMYPTVAETERDVESVARGRTLFLDAGRTNCAGCHGPTGRGDGPTADGYLDDWGYPIRPRDFSAGVFRAGDSPADLYQSIASGITGTPMGAFGGNLKGEEIWDLVHFVQSLGGALTGEGE